MTYKDIYYIDVGNITTETLTAITKTLAVKWSPTPTSTLIYEPIQVTNGLDKWEVVSFSEPKDLNATYVPEDNTEVQDNVHFSSKQDSWCTPKEVIDAIAWMGPIRLDPCSNEQSIVPAVFKYDLKDGFDGLEHPWSHADMVGYYGGGVKKGLVYVNPPYGKEIGKWTKRAMVTASLFPADEIVMLVPARTDTKWWHEVVQETSAVCFWRGRLTFLGASSNAPFPSALLYFGPRADEFCKNLADKGWCTKSK